jgi:Uma2 family endonuclease
MQKSLPRDAEMLRCVACGRRLGYDQAMSTEILNKKLFTVDEYYRLSELGILDDDRRYELIRGEIIEMPTAGSPHAGRVKRMNRLFTSRLGDSVIVSVQDPLRIDRLSEPVPDVALLEPRPDFYAERHPLPSDTLLVIEVSDTTVRKDSKIKAPLYAEAGIAEYWQLDVNKEMLVVRTDPAAGEYRKVRILHRGETVVPQKLPNVSFTVDEILG